MINVSGAFVIGYLSILFTVDWRDRYGVTLECCRAHTGANTMLNMIILIFVGGAFGAMCREF